GHPDVYAPAHRSLGNSERDMTREWGEVVVRANAGDVVIEPLQAGETNQTRTRSAADEVEHGDVLTPQAQIADLQDTLFLLADQTGGRLMLHGADVESAVGRAIDEARAYYVVTFTPPTRPPGTD